MLVQGHVPIYSANLAVSPFTWGGRYGTLFLGAEILHGSALESPDHACRTHRSRAILFHYSVVLVASTATT